MDKVKKEMRSIIKRDIPFMKRSIATAEAAELFHKYQMYDKEKLFRYRRVSSANLYNLDGFEDYYYGYMPASTGILKYFDIFPYEDGFILMLPIKEEPETIPEFKPRKNLFETLQQANQWGRTMEISTVGSMNDEITKGNMNDIILIQEALQEKRIAEIAEKIKSAGNKKFIMIAGPSSSGKTTFSHRLSIQLRTLGYKPHPIAIDDYFVNREDTPKDEFGKFNFESIHAIDIEQFNKDMTALLNGETVELPNFNFKSGLREYKGNFKKLGPEDILVIEGIHGLNDELSYSLPKESRFKIYISALTQLNIDEHNRIPTTDGRLIRRMVRDARTRGTSARETIAMWPSVRRGEEENIFPFQEEADCMFNSALIYELSVLKQYAEPALFGIDKDCKEYIEAKRLLKFLDYFLGVSSEDIPKNSIIREFIGGSCFKV
jgi:uridine kinase